MSTERRAANGRLFAARDVPESRWQFVQWQKALRTGLPATVYETAPQKQEPFISY